MSNLEKGRKAVAERLKSARLTKGMTQGDLSRALEGFGLSLSTSAIAKIENSKRGVDIVEASIFSKVLGIRLDVLAEGKANSIEAGILLQQQSFTSAFSVLRFIESAAEEVDQYIEIVAERMLLPEGDPYHVGTISATESGAAAERIIHLLNEIMRTWLEMVTCGKTFDSTYDPELSDFTLKPVLVRYSRRKDIYEYDQG